MAVQAMGRKGGGYPRDNRLTFAATCSWAAMHHCGGGPACHESGCCFCCGANLFTDHQMGLLERLRPASFVKRSPTTRLDFRANATAEFKGKNIEDLIRSSCCTAQQLLETKVPRWSRLIPRTWQPVPLRTAIRRLAK